MPFWAWSKVPNLNSDGDVTIDFSEGQSPGSLNDSARALMAALRMWGDDISGAIVTGGSSTAYTVASNSGYDSFAHLANQVIAFSPHATNGAGPVTINIDGLGAVALRTSPSTELLAGVLIQGTPYLCIFNNSDGACYLQGFFGNPYNVPLGAGMDYWLPTAPNSSFVFPIGQAISRTTYATLFAAMGTTYGTGDGSTTFNVPDKTGRVSAMKEATATRLTTAKVGVDGGTLGAAGGGTQTLVTGNLPPYTPAGTIAASSSTSVSNGTTGLAGNSGGGFSSGGAFPAPTPMTLATTTTATFTGSAQGGTSTPINVAQPTIVCNYILRVI